MKRKRLKTVIRHPIKPQEWLRQDCGDDVEMIAHIIESCVRPRDGSNET